MWSPLWTCVCVCLFLFITFESRSVFTILCDIVQKTGSGLWCHEVNRKSIEFLRRAAVAVLSMSTGGQQWGGVHVGQGQTLTSGVIRRRASTLSVFGLYPHSGLRASGTHTHTNTHKHTQTHTQRDDCKITPQIWLCLHSESGHKSPFKIVLWNKPPVRPDIQVEV